MKAGITLRDLKYDGLELNIEIEASNGPFSGATEVYCYPEDLAELGARLKAFPQTATDTVVFELGQDDDRFAHYLLIKAQVVDAVGHSSLKLVLCQRGLGGGRTELEILCEPAGLNRLGDQLASWAEDRSAPLSWSPRY